MIKYLLELYRVLRAGRDEDRLEYVGGAISRASKLQPRVCCSWMPHGRVGRMSKEEQNFKHTKAQEVPILLSRSMHVCVCAFSSCFQHN